MAEMGFQEMPKQRDRSDRAGICKLDTDLDGLSDDRETDL